MDFKKSRKEAVVKYAKELKKDVERLEDNNSKLQKDITKSESSCKSALSRADKLGKEKRILINDLKEADSKNTSLQQNLKLKDAEIAKLEEQLKATEELYAKEQALSKSRKEDISDLKSSINIKNDTLGALREKNKKGLADARMIQELNNSWMLRVYHLFVSIPS